MNKEIESLKSDILIFYKCKDELRNEMIEIVSNKYKGIIMTLVRTNKLDLLDPLLNWIMNRGNEGGEELEKAKTMLDVVGKPINKTWKDFLTK